MQFIIWTGIAVLGLMTLSTMGMVFFHAVGEFRKRGAEPIVDEFALPTRRRSHMRKVDLESLRDRPPIRRAA
ncbi:MAG: hypothetical protein HKN29_08325 [Rhodothermales bacterium]|nr:hypothetical protein [Rhodothermales bacterium]